MNGQVLLERGVKAKKQGAMALFSSEAKQLRREVSAAIDAAKAQAERDRSAGRTPRFCLPAKGGSMGADELIRRVQAIPESDRRRIDSTEVMTRVFASKFPCR